ncbi:glycosyltransferase family 2 protein [Bacteroides sp. 214]|uniref:glycosyltransferase family 2 protein n=1 Tax=Bacteroides sp. 214 TaxID=2302935 RepID=UPI0013CF7E7A|nr:glycosyltransferase family 2 protein [Bacteroides sp. 214]NDW13592.1 glycosyltransferase family 2 protein [Bacteroides sp. 214]
MLSILIPTYNLSCVELAKELHCQATSAGILFEMLVADDCSVVDAARVANQQIAELSNARFIEMKENMGPAKLRNYLARQARYKYLLFVDSDTFPVSTNFIKAYLEATTENSVVYGGFVYKRELPPAEYLLRYYYGIHVEERSLQERLRRPYHSFITMCFLIPRVVFLQVLFDESFHLGYEDSLFGMRLQQQNIPVVHIDNPVYHNHSCNNEVFLFKTRRAVQNLVGHEEEMRSMVRLLKIYHTIKCMRLVKPVAWFFAMTQKSIEKNLCGTSPSLKLFAFYKLAYLCSLKTTKLP